MDLRELVRALRVGDTMAVREWAHEARRRRDDLTNLSLPSGLTQEECALAAGVLEMLAERWDVPPPPWTSRIGPAEEEVWLTLHGRRIPELRERCQRHGPEPLRRRRILALPDFMSVP